MFIVCHPTWAEQLPTRTLADYVDAIQQNPEQDIPQLDQLAKQLAGLCVDLQECPYVRHVQSDGLAAYLARRVDRALQHQASTQPGFSFHGKDKPAARAEMVVLGRFQDCLSPLMCNRTVGFLVYQHSFDFNSAKKEAGEGGVQSTTFMHHAFNVDTMPREIDETEERMEPLGRDALRLWAACGDTSFRKVKALLDGRASGFPLSNGLGHELAACRQSVRARLTELLEACERASRLNVDATYEDLLALLHMTATGHDWRGRPVPHVRLPARGGGGGSGNGGSGSVEWYGAGAGAGAGAGGGAGVGICRGVGGDSCIDMAMHVRLGFAAVGRRPCTCCPAVGTRPACDSPAPNDCHLAGSPPS